jgi:hypothetical protein
VPADGLLAQGRVTLSQLDTSLVRRGAATEEDVLNQPEWLAEQFEAHRAHLKAVAYRMLGSPSEADDAVQEAWAAAQPRRQQRRRESRRMAGHGRRQGVRGHAALARVTARGTARRPAGRARRRRHAKDARMALINGIPGAVWAPGGTPRVIFSFTFVARRITAIDTLADPGVVSRLDVAILSG